MFIKKTVFGFVLFTMFCLAASENVSDLSFSIRILEPTEWALWKDLRLEALQKSPESFGAALEDELELSDTKWQEKFLNDTVFGAFKDDELVGCVCFTHIQGCKRKHKGFVSGMYVRPEARGKGVGDSLMQAVIAHAKKHVIQIKLDCFTINGGAINLYEKYGFVVYGVEPRSHKVGETYYDCALMLLNFF